MLLRAVQRQVLCELVQLLVAGRAQLEIPGYRRGQRQFRLTENIVTKHRKGIVFLFRVHNPWKTSYNKKSKDWSLVLN